VHIDDVAQAVARLLAPATSSPPLRRIIECVGAADVTLAGLISSYRTQRGGRAPWVLAVPGLMLRAMAWLGDRIPAMPIGTDTLTMLASGSSGHVEKFSELLGRAPRSYREFLREH
jgi:hypothetical protein